MTPTFIFSMGRSGSTLLQRLLNAHPRVFIYGEHNGILEPLCESIALLEFNGKAAEKHGQMILNKADVESTFIAWARPFGHPEYITALRQFILRIYKVDMLPQHAVWGFKEIRYDAPVAATLLEMFRESKVIILQRNFVEFFLSWNRSFNRKEEASYLLFKELTEGYVAKYEGFLSLQSACGSARVARIRYENLAEDAWPSMAALFDWLGLPVDAETQHRTCRTAAVHVDYVGRKAGAACPPVAQWLARLRSEEPELAARLHSVSR